MLVDICGVRALIYKRRIMYIMYSLVCCGVVSGVLARVYLFIFCVCLFYLMWFWLIGVHLGWLFYLLIMFELWLLGKLFWRVQIVVLIDWLCLCPVWI